MCKLIVINLNPFREIIGKLATVADVDDACLAVGGLVSLLEQDHAWDRVSPTEVGDSIVGAWGVS